MRMPFLAAFAGALLMVGCGAKSESPAEGAAPVPAAGAPASRPAVASQMSTRPTAASSMREVERILSQYKAVESPQGIVLQVPADVLFDFDRSDLRPDAQTALGDLLKVVQHYGTRPIAVEGHTDAKGDDAYNQTLSERRAATVRDWMAANGVAAGRLSAAGYGEKRPVAPNARPDGADDPEGRQKNRRVEVIVRPG